MRYRLGNFSGNFSLVPYFGNVHPEWVGTDLCECCAGSGRRWSGVTIRRHVENYVKKHNKTYEWLAGELEVSKAHLSQMLKGEDKKWQVGHLRKLFTVLFPNRGTTEEY